MSKIKTNEILERLLDLIEVQTAATTTLQTTDSTTQHVTSDMMAKLAESLKDVPITPELKDALKEWVADFCQTELENLAKKVSEQVEKLEHMELALEKRFASLETKLSSCKETDKAQQKEIEETKAKLKIHKEALNLTFATFGWLEPGESLKKEVKKLTPQKAMKKILKKGQKHGGGSYNKRACIDVDCGEVFDNGK